MKNETLSVHIVTFNSAEDISACIDAIVDQSYAVDEVIIVDNASIDASVEIIRRLMDKYPDQKIRLIENAHNIGFAEAHNQAIRATNTTYVCVLNPDVVLHSDYLRFLVSRMNSDSNIGSATGKLYRNNKILDSTGIVINKTRRAFDRGAGEVDQGQWDSKSNVFGVSGAAALYRRAMIDDISIDGDFFDRHFFAYKEDVDVAWRAQLFGWGAYYEPLALAAHKRGWGEKKDRREVPLKIRQHSFLNRYYMMVKNDRLRDIIVHFPYIIGFEFASFVFILLREREMLSAYTLFRKHLPEMMGKRKWIWQRRAQENNRAHQVKRFF